MKLPLTVLNSKETKELIKKLSNSFGCDLESLKKEYFFLFSETRKRYYILKKYDGFDKIPENLRVNRAGCYFATEDKDGLRLSIEGSQIIGPSASKNIIEIDEKSMNKWILGEEIEINESLEKQINDKVDISINKFVIVKHGNDFLGCGKVAKEKILNFVPKERRVHALFD